ncbi:MAG: DMT family transporter [Candidatus Competibacteraceae bacterium]|nr:DMT family transporter [Candidatus Competibacteraceae bacterium]MBK8899051.1 DMT family transporter [Candidatus Competibacteraceae bacterium]MBK8963093.1 DMT family transporter [Candidatus Competibacteraceae bacterium]MBK9952056.1 DMT family transporter [Candidatus Competibacteraceae bacterium]
MLDPRRAWHPSPYLLLVLTTLFWSGNFVLGRAVHTVFTPFTLSFWRWAVALVILLPFVGSSLREQGPLLRRNWPILLLLSVLGVVNFNTFVYIGLQETTATNALIVLSITPVLIVGLSFLLLRQTVTIWQTSGILISLIGVSVIVGRGDLNALLARQVNHGDLWVLAAVLSWALYSVCLRWRPAELKPLNFQAATMVFGTLILGPLYAWDLSRGRTVALNAATVGTVLYLALLPSILAYIFWNRAVAELGANRTGQFLHLMPAFGAVLSMIFLGERLYAFHAAGIALIGSGIWLATMLGRSKAP